MAGIVLTIHHAIVLILASFYKSTRDSPFLVFISSLLSPNLCPLPIVSSSLSHKRVHGIFFGGFLAAAAPNRGGARDTRAALTNQ